MAEDNASLRASLQAAQDLLRIAPAFFGYLGKRGEVVDCNELALQIIAAARDEVIGRLFWELPWWASIPESAARVRTAVEAALRGETSQFDIEYAAVTPGTRERQVRWVGLTVAPVNDGGVKCVAATGIDITDRVHARQELELSEARYRGAMAQLELALMNGQMGTWHVDLSTSQLTTSATTAAIFGVDAVAEDAASFIMKSLHPDDAERVNQSWQRAVAEGSQLVEEYRLIRPDGTVRWALVRGSTKHDGQGGASYFSGVIADITDRKLHETEIHNERNMLEQIFRESPAAMALWRGPRHEFELVNPEYQAIFGDRQLVGLPLVEALPEMRGQPFPDILTRVLESGEAHIGREVVARVGPSPEGLEDRYYDFSYIPIVDPSGAPYGVYDHAVDVTERVMARRALEASVRELEQERELRERFVAALSHDLRTPLAAARLSAELMIHKADDQRQLLKATQRIVSNMDRADAMIRDLLDASRIKAGEPLPLEIDSHDLRELAQATLEDLTSIHGDRFVLAASPVIRGHWDGTAVRRIIENLASNGAKYGKPGTPVTVWLQASAHIAEIQVHNDGTPIPAVEQPEMFELFKRSATANGSSHKGWGIGLSLVAGLARAHGGEAIVRSNTGEGTRFIVRLPLDARVVL